MTDELLERMVKVDEDIVRVMKRLDTSFDRRLEPIKIQMEYNRKIIFKIIVPLVVGMVLMMAASSDTGSIAINSAGNVIKNFIGQ